MRSRARRPALIAPWFAFGPSLCPGPLVVGVVHGRPASSPSLNDKVSKILQSDGLGEGLAYSFLLFGPGFARGLSCPSTTAPERRFWPGLGPPKPFFFPSACGCPSAEGLSSVGSVAVSAVASVFVLPSGFISAASGDSLAAMAGVELDSDVGDFIGEEFEAGLSCGKADRIFEGTLSTMDLFCFDFAPRKLEAAPLADGFADMATMVDVLMVKGDARGDC